jgi:hypothetical protein
MRLRIGIASLALAVAIVGIDGWLSNAQPQSVTLPANWQKMSPTDFAAAIGPLYASDTFRNLSAQDQQAAKDQGETLFLQIDIANTTLSYQTLEVLHHLARYQLDPDQIDKTKTALLARQDNWAGRPYSDIRAKVVMMMRLDVPEPLQLREARRWVAAGGTQAQVPQADLQYDIARQMFTDLKVVANSFSVQWSGLLNAPQSGDYTFYISPININAGFKPNPVKFRMTVSVAGQLILESNPGDSGTASFPGYKPDAKPPEWTSQSKPVTLTSGQPVSLQVTVSADVIRGLPSGILHAMLFWQRPGVPKSLVPASSLTLPSGGPGLQAIYSWTGQGQAQSLTRTDPVIDFAWTNSSILLSENTTVANQAADEMWQAMTAAAFLTTLTGPPAALHPFFKDASDAASGLTTARRQAFLDSVLQNPTLLDAVDAKSAARFYEAFRMGAPEKALDAFGTWATRHADLACDFSDDRFFDGDNRAAMADMAAFTTLQLPDQVARLQNQYLQLPNGQCVLPVAYTLSYSYLGQRKIADWIALLDAKLADPTVTGDLRVNWLLARAHAQELVRNPSKHYPLRWPFPASWPLDGRKYLDQALQAAQSAGVKMRVAREIVGRLAAARQFDAATAFVQQLVGSLPDDQKAVASNWATQLAAFAADQARQPIRAKQAYLKTLQSRRSRAAQNGDTATVTRYDALINAVQNRP